MENIHIRDFIGPAPQEKKIITEFEFRKWETVSLLKSERRKKIET